MRSMLAIIMTAVVVASTMPANAAEQSGPVKVVYHLNQGTEQATAAAKIVPSGVAEVSRLQFKDG